MSARANGVVELLEGDGLAIEFCRQGQRALVGAVRNIDMAGAVGQQMTGRELAHLPAPDQINTLAFQVAENLLGQIHCDRRHRNCRGRDRRFVAYPLGDREGPGQQRVQLRIDCAHRARGSIGFLHLTQNLRLAYHHRIQAGGHAKHVPHRIAFVILVQVLAVGCGSKP